jgi:hypothetical protein
MADRHRERRRDQPSIDECERIFSLKDTRDKELTA